MPTKKTQANQGPQPRREIVIAPPGCGKTEQLASDIADLLAKKTDPNDILCITFTNQAADEMEERVQRLLRKRMGLRKRQNTKEQEGSKGQEDLPSPTISTLHAFCLQRLRSMGRKITIIDETLFKQFASWRDKDDPVLQKYSSLNNINKANYDPNRPYHREIPYQNVIQEAFFMRQRLPFRKVQNWDDEHNKMLEAFARSYLRWKGKMSPDGKTMYMDFNDILFETKSAISTVEWEELKRYPWVFVDEVQDLTALQLEIAESLVSSNGCIRFFGDPQQAIYGFMGTQVRDLLRLYSTCEKPRPLNTNYRSPKYLLDGINRYSENYILSEFKNYINIDELKPFEGLNWEQKASRKMKKVPRENNATAVLHASSFEKEIEGIMKCIDSYPLRESNAILARENKDVHSIISALKQHRKYFILSSDGREHTYFLRLLSAHIAVCLDPNNTDAWARLLPLVTRSEHRMASLPIVSLLESFALSPIDLMKTRPQEEFDDKDERDSFLARGGIRILHHKLYFQYRQLFEQTCDDIAALIKREGEDTNILNGLICGRLKAWYENFVEKGFLQPLYKPLWHAACRIIQIKLKYGPSKDPSEGETTVVKWQLQRVSHLMDNALSAEKLFPYAQISRRIVSVMTIHQAKGRGFDNVFLFNAREEVFHPRISEDMEIRERMERMELRRLYYVGITRAKKRLILTLSDGSDDFEEIGADPDSKEDFQPRKSQNEKNAEVPPFINDALPETGYWDSYAEYARIDPDEIEDLYIPSNF